jgi:predicted amidophosphoribosyltransferase
MDKIKYVCQKCLYEQKEPGICPRCKIPLVASCPVCGNPIVGEHVHLEQT